MEDPRRVSLMEWIERHEDYFGPAMTALFRRGRAQVREGEQWHIVRGTSFPQSIHFHKQVVSATLTSGFTAAPTAAAAAAAANGPVAALTQQEAGTGKKEEEHKTAAAALPADLRDAVFGIPLLVQTIAEF